MDRHNRAEASKEPDPSSVASTVASTVSSTIAGRSYSCSNAVQEDSKDLREFMTRLMKNFDFGLRRFIFEDVDRTHLNFYNKVMLVMISTSFVTRCLCFLSINIANK